MRAPRSALPLLFLVLVLALPAAGQQKKDGGDLNEKERALQQTQKRLKEERAKAAEARKREAGILSELETIDRRLNDKRKQVALLDGRIVMSGGEELSHQLEANGYDWVREQVGLPSGVGDEVAEPVAEHV